MKPETVLKIELERGFFSESNSYITENTTKRIKTIRNRLLSTIYKIKKSV